MLPIVMLAVGLLLGALAGWLALRGRDQALQAVLHERDTQLAEAKEAVTRQQGRMDAADQKAEAEQTLERDWERLVAYHRYPQEHWKHLRTDAAQRFISGHRRHLEAAAFFARGRSGNSPFPFLR